MLFTITYTGPSATDLGYLLHKNPYRPQVFDLNHGQAYIFYPEISDEQTTAALLLDIDPLDLSRGKAGSGGRGLFDYVNDRPYVSSSFLSTAIARVFGTAMTGRSDKRQELADSALDLTATITMMPCRGDQSMLDRVFTPLGYGVSYETFILDQQFPDWGKSAYVNLTLKGQTRLRDLLSHLYILIPVFDSQKHYWTDTAEVEKLLRKGEEWLPHHPEKSFITRRYLDRRRSLIDLAYARLTSSDTEDPDTEDLIPTGLTPGELTPGELTPKGLSPEGLKLNLNARRLGSVTAALKTCGAKSVIDMGCGEGHLLVQLVKEKQFTRLAGFDVSHTALKRAHTKLKLDRVSDSLRERLILFQSSLLYKDTRFSGYDAACVIEVIEHLDTPRLAAFEQVLFGCARPPSVIVTTPNREYNVKYDSLDNETLRHSDHRFEWTRTEFRQWAEDIAARHGYKVQFSEIGDTDPAVGAPTQMGVFSLCV